MDVVTAYLYDNLDSDIYVKVLEGIPIPNQDRENRGPVFYFDYALAPRPWTGLAGKGCGTSTSS